MIVNPFKLAYVSVQVQNAAQLPSNLVLINGPFKTADIEMNLITCMNGPKYLHVMLLNEM